MSDNIYMPPGPTTSTSSVIDRPPPIPSEGGIFLSSSEVADILGCDRRTAIRLFASGNLRAFRLGPGRTSWRVSETALWEFITRYGHHEPATVATSADPDQLPTPAPAPALLTRRRTPEGLQLIGLQPPDPDA